MEPNNKMFQSDLETIEEFLERWKIQNFTALSKIDEKNSEEERIMLLACALPVEIVTDIQRKLKPTVLSKAKYADVEKHLLSLFSKKKSMVGAAVSFLARKQLSSESIEMYAKSLNELASQCDYGECCRNKLLRDVFISGLKSSKIMTATIQDAEGKSFDDVVKKAKLIEQVQSDVADISTPSQQTFSQNKVKKVEGERNNSKISPTYVCIRCAAKGRHTADVCWARKVTCNACHNVGHIAKACKSSKNKKPSATNKEMKHVDKGDSEEDDPAKWFVMHSIGEIAESTGEDSSQADSSRPDSSRASSQGQRGGGVAARGTTTTHRNVASFTPRASSPIIGNRFASLPIDEESWEDCSSTFISDKNDSNNSFLGLIN